MGIRIVLSNKKMLTKLLKEWINRASKCIKGFEIGHANIISVANNIRKTINVMAN